MSFDLPPHLQTLNSLPTSSPPSGINHEQEEAFWGYMHTDDLFANFGFVPSPNELEKDDLTTTTQPTPATLPVAAPAPTPATTGTGEEKSQPQATLESFLAAFANEPNFLMSTPSGSGSGSGGISTREILSNTAVGTPAYGYDEDEDKPSGAKKLKSIGAGHVEIEEDKRRRNTEASARFRAKKKEREQAVEKRAKDLEAQVAKLAAEKASLENENRLLKAIVLNGTGPMGTGSGAASGPTGTIGGAGGVGGQSQAEMLQGALAAFGKRKREA